MKNVIIFGCGLLVGAAGGVAISHFVLKKNILEQADAEMEALVKQINDERAYLKDKYMSNKPDILSFSEEKKEEAEEVKSEPVEEVKPEKPKTKAASKKKKPSIYDISKDDFDDVDNRKKVYLSFYTGDSVLADAYSDKQVDISSTIGYPMLDKLGGDKLDAIYVRNDILNTDYEVTRDYRSFAELMAEEDEDPEY